MSLVSTYVRAADGKLYKNPSVRGDFWFVCFDDDEPPELVVMEGFDRPFFTWFKVKKYDKHHPRRCGRSFNGEFHDALAYFGKLVDRIPIPEKHEGTATRDQVGQGFVIDPPRRRRNAHLGK